MENIQSSLMYGILLKWYRWGLDLLIHKYPNNYSPHRLWYILIFDIEANIQNKSLGILSMEKAEHLDGLAPDQYSIRKAKDAYMHALNTRIFYNLINL